MRSLRRYKSLFTTTWRRLINYLQFDVLQTVLLNLTLCFWKRYKVYSCLDVVVTSDGTSTRNRNRESKISELFLVSESENFNRVIDSENDSLEFVCLQLKLQVKNFGT